MNKDVNLRIGNISFESSRSRYEIVKYELNPYYGKEDDYELIELKSILNFDDSIPYEDKEKVYAYTPKGEYNCVIDKSCFVNPESCYVVAHFEVDKDGWADLVWCGDRPLKLSKTEWKNFMECVQFGYKHINGSLYDEDNE